MLILCNIRQNTWMLNVFWLVSMTDVSNSSSPCIQLTNPWEPPVSMVRYGHDDRGPNQELTTRLYLILKAFHLPFQAPLTSWIPLPSRSTLRVHIRQCRSTFQTLQVAIFIWVVFVFVNSVQSLHTVLICGVLSDRESRSIWRRDPYQGRWNRGCQKVVYVRVFIGLRESFRIPTCC